MGHLDQEVWLEKKVKEVHLEKEVKLDLLGLLEKVLDLMPRHWLP